MNGFSRVTAGHYRHAETGIEIVKVPAHREGARAVGVRWNILVPGEKSHTTLTYGGAATLKDAVAWATTGEDSFVEIKRAAIAAAWNEAHAEDAERESFQQNYRWAERHDLPSGRREHINRAIDADHVEALAMNGDAGTPVDAILRLIDHP